MTTVNPLFSILMANYNNGPYLMNAVNSVKAQSYLNWEIIIVDDKSTDCSFDLYKELEQEPNIHIYYNSVNKGCGFTKNRCAAEAHGEICGFLDPDDMLLPDAIEKHVTAHINNPTASVVYSKAHYCDTNFNKVLEDEQLPDFSSGRTYFDYRWVGSMHLTTYKKSFYDKTEGINPKAAAGVDQDLYFLIEEVGDIVGLDEFCYNYVIKGNNTSIATNDANYVNLWYWNLHARYRAAKRRGLDADIIIKKDMERVFDNYVKMQLGKAVYTKELEIRSSHAYKIGKSIVSFFQTIAKPFKFKK